jgi:hypothetical protein
MVGMPSGGALVILAALIHQVCIASPVGVLDRSAPLQIQARLHQRYPSSGNVRPVSLLSVRETTVLSTSGSPAEASTEARPKFKGVSFNKRLMVNGTIECGSLETGNLTVLGDVSVASVRSSRVSTTLVSTDVLETGIIRSPTNTITIDGNLVLGGSNAGASSFLATEVIIGGVKQWRLLYHDDFEPDVENSDGWDVAARGICGPESKDWFLGGHCKTATENATKTYEKLPIHTQLRVKARVHFLDQWDGEMAFMKVDGQFMWADSATSPKQGINICGSSASEARLSVPVDITLTHSGPSATVSFGSTLQGDPCMHSWAVDDVVLYIR